MGLDLLLAGSGFCAVFYLVWLVFLFCWLLRFWVWFVNRLLCQAACRFGLWWVVGCGRFCGFSLGLALVCGWVWLVAGLSGFRLAVIGVLGDVL